MNDSAEKLINLARGADFDPLSLFLQLAADSDDSDSSDNDNDAEDQSEAAEACDNENMLQSGLGLGSTGLVNYGSVNLGHVAPHISGKGFVGTHPSGVKTKKYPTRARAAMALRDLHHYIPKDKSKAAHKLIAMSATQVDPIELLVSLAADAPRTYDTAIRQKYASKGVALPDGSFPIPDRDALKDAIHDYGRAKNQAAAKAHIIKRAKALGAADSLPEGWA